MPQGKEYQDFRVSRYKTSKPENSEVVRVVTKYMA
jgi:hypothetical protein